MIRDESLDAVVSMRSNDAVLGLPYDVFLFTFLQEMMAVELDLKLGAYHHFASSLHLYEKHRALATRVVAARPETRFTMPPLQNIHAVNEFLEVERKIREAADGYRASDGCGYWKDLADVLSLFNRSRLFGWPTALEGTSSPYLAVIAPLAGKEAMISTTDTGT